ncbi:flagellar biosynthetic protein FliO [Pseudoduganella sp. UC29_106]|uniref:flagellar biosynthetic protein FliO n=1 Tax=Pseudoduganella sp. UC29_106 TaxID=3374553 RepID=UPI003756472D
MLSSWPPAWRPPGPVLARAAKPATDTTSTSKPRAAADAPAQAAGPADAAAAAPAATDAGAAPVAAAPAPATPEQQAALAGARPAQPGAALPQAPSALGSLVQTILSLGLVIGLLVGLAWLLKRFGPKTITGGTTVKLVGALSVGARERILVVEVGEQWIVVGASPGRMNALATMPRQETRRSRTGSLFSAAGSELRRVVQTDD